ncbi:disintegrin and metalloproteinase domain-containing protein 12-like [Diadema antillarum]|uniref:disintegrin and metalloproteinase domain-containing protein 12-like n=1 Tax=Diadema antillarum TaxID=105358 RepID=UPI003A83BCDB
MDWRVLIFTVLVLFLPLQDVQTRGVERGSTQERLLKQLRNYEIVTPYRLDGRHRRAANTLSQDGHLVEASFLLPAFGKEYVLDVRLNENLFPSRYVETEYTEDGDLITRLPHRNHHCYYQGVVRQGNVSAVAISTCEGLRGMVNVDGEALRVEPLEGSSGQHHVVYKEEDVISDGKKLLMDVKYGTSESVEKLEELAAKHRHRRDILTETKYIEMVIVNDDKELQFRRNDINAVRQRSKDLANAMDMLYRQLNIRIALVALEVWRSPLIDVTSDAQSNLVKFQDWRRTDLIHRIPNDNAQLITGQIFTDSIVGMAEHGKMCTEDKSCGVSTDLELPLARQAVIITHEIGHNLGFFHNTPACTCPDTSCIMDESLAEPPSTMFSSCTRDTLEDVLMKGYGVCLLDYPKSFYGGPVCGNRFLEEGEECDCGTPEECDTKCCIAETCRFHVNATCAAGQCCDEYCQMKSRGALCRDTFNECDLPEYCTGMSAEESATAEDGNPSQGQSAGTATADCFRLFSVLPFV